MRVVLVATVRDPWWYVRHPRTFALFLVAYWLTFTIGPVPVVMIAALIGAILWAWSIKHHDSFERLTGRPWRTHWRRVTRYEFGWNTRMRLMGLVRHVDRRFAVPRISRVVAGEGIDHLAISLPAGLTPPDVDEAADELAHGYGARHCRVRMRGPSAVQLDLGFADRLAEIVEPAPRLALVHHALGLARPRRWRDRIGQGIGRPVDHPARGAGDPGSHGRYLGDRPQRRDGARAARRPARSPGALEKRDHGQDDERREIDGQSPNGPDRQFGMGVRGDGSL